MRNNGVFANCGSGREQPRAKGVGGAKAQPQPQTGQIVTIQPKENELTTINNRLQRYNYNLQND